MNGSLTIGLHMTAGHENTSRQIDGIIQYAANHAINLADFCYPGDDPDLTDAPPWLGKPWRHRLCPSPSRHRALAPPRRRADLALALICAKT